MASAEELKRLGNDSFGRKEYKAAIELYSQAIQISASDGLHLLYSNRSVAYLLANQAGQALDDADKCISLQPSFAKGHIRKGDCLVQLMRFPEAAEAYGAALEVDPTNAIAAASALEALRSHWNPIYQAFYKDKIRNFPVRVAFVDKHQGKGLLATKDIPEGSTIFVEKPLVCVQWTSSVPTAFCCRRCLRFVGSLESQCAYMFGAESYPPLPLSELYYQKDTIPDPVFCDKCQEALYCSPKCRQLSRFEHHELLCSCNSAASAFLTHCRTEQCDRFLLAGQLIASIVLKMRRSKLSFSEASHSISLFQKGSWVQIIANQVVDSQQRASAAKRLQAALKLSHGLLKAAIAQPLNPFVESNYQLALELDFYDQVLGMFQLNNPRVEITSPLYGYCRMLASAAGGPALVATNGTLRNMMTQLGQRFEGVPPSCNGEGLFTLHSCMNHSCTPNAKQIVPESGLEAEIAIVALAPIRKDQQITISYINTESKSTLERRTELKRDYLFDCRCDQCK